MTADLVVDLFVSVDGWAGSDGLPGYFGYLGPELEEWITTNAAEPQVKLPGRRTYKLLSGLPDEAHDGSADHLARSEKVVFSRTLTKVTWSNSRISGDLLDGVRALKADGTVPLRTVGSLSVVRQLLDAGLVAADELSATCWPVWARGSVCRRGVRGPSSGCLSGT